MHVRLVRDISGVTNRAVPSDLGYTGLPGKHLPGLCLYAIHPIAEVSLTGRLTIHDSWPQRQSARDSHERKPQMSSEVFQRRSLWSNLLAEGWPVAATESCNHLRGTSKFPMKVSQYASQETRGCQIHVFKVRARGHCKSHFMRFWCCGPPSLPGSVPEVQQEVPLAQSRVADSI